MLWAISTATAPDMLKKEVEEIRERSKVNLSYLKDGFQAHRMNPSSRERSKSTSVRLRK